MANTLPIFKELEKTMNRLNRVIGLAAFSLMVLGLPAMASAQYYPNYPNDRSGRSDGRYDDRYGRNDRSYGGYDQRSLIRNLKQNTREFTRQLDRDLDRSRMNGTRREDQINDMAARFRDAVNRLDNNGYYDNRRNIYGGNNEMRRLYDLAAQIERSIGRAQISYHTRNLWSAVRNDLQALSRGYGYNNGRYGYPGNNNGRYGNGRNGLPSWWPF